MSLTPLIRFLMVFGAVAASAAIAQPASAPGLAALKTIEKGMWQFRESGVAGAGQRICVKDPIALMQIRHSGAVCSRYIIEDATDRATVHYTCPSNGHGRTTIRVETRRLVQIDSQGIADNAPFAVRYEGRRVGQCR